jgi:hypothetical protein
MSAHAITVAELEEIAADCGVRFLPGDILIVRTGWVKWFEEHSQAERSQYITNAYAWAGVKGCEETMEWLWDRHFAAVAGDSNGFEVVPMDPKWSEASLYLRYLSSLDGADMRRQGSTTFASPCGGCQSGRCGIWKGSPKSVRGSSGGPFS